MTALEALAVLEAAVLECKTRDINTAGSSGGFGLARGRENAACVIG